MKTSDIFALFKMKGKLLTVSKYLNVKILGRILRRARAESVQPETKLIILTAIIIVFTSRIEFAIDKLPVITTFFVIIVERNAASVVLNLNGPVAKTYDLDAISVAFSGFVNRVRENLKEGVLTPF